MTASASTAAAPPPPSSDSPTGGDKYEERRRELALAAQETLAELGYARTSLREIAQHSDWSHGIFHYYFSNKQELVTYSVALYKDHCATRFDEVVATATNGDELLAGFRTQLRSSLVDDARMHRLWYDLRNQSMFESTFRDEVRAIDQLLEDMVWRVLSRYAALVDGRVVVGPGVAYGLFDGLFLQALVALPADPGAAADALDQAAATLVPSLVAVDAATA